MNKYFLLFLFLPSAIFAQPEQMKFKKKAPEYIFLKEAELAAKAHDADKLLSMMEPGYKRTQHDEFLEGRTLQFLTEFFCSEIPFNKIETARLIRYDKMRDENFSWEVTMYISGNNKECYATFFLTKHPDTHVLSLYGAVG